MPPKGKIKKKFEIYDHLRARYIYITPNEPL